MLTIFSVSCPVYLLILIGYGFTHAGIFKKEEMRVLGKFVINLALPALIFNSLSRISFSQAFNLTYFLAYLFGALLVMFLGFILLRPYPVNRAIYVLGMSCSNSGFVGYPIVLLALPLVAESALALNLIIENCIVIPLVLTLAELHVNKDAHWKKQMHQSMIGLGRNPLVIALLAGAAASYFGITLPTPVSRTISMLAAASGAISLFVIGGTLFNLPMQGLARKALPIVATKLLLHPLAVALAITVLPLLFGLPVLNPSMRTAAILFAAMPMMGVYPIFAQKYGKENLASATLLMATVSSVLTLNLLLWLLLA